MSELSNVQWVLVAIMVISAITACVLQLTMFSHVARKEGNLNLFITKWILDPDCLTPRGQQLRKMIFLCWLVIFALMLVVKGLEGSAETPL